MTEAQIKTKETPFPSHHIGKNLKDNNTKCWQERRRNKNQAENIGNKSKNKQMGPNEILKLLHNKGNSKQGEKTALRLGENNSKRSNRQRINLKNIQATPVAQFLKNK